MRRFPRPRRTAGQSFDHVIESQPQTPTMMIQSQRTSDAKHEQNGQDSLLAQIGEEQTKKVNDQNQRLGSYYVRHDRAHEKAFLAFESYVAGSAVRFDIEGFLENCRLTTGRAP
jgi:hypothetical protein